MRTLQVPPGALFLSVALLSASLLLSNAPCRAANAQADHDRSDYRLGLIPDSAARLAGVPMTPLYRGFLPPRVDLSDNFPAPGNQGQQSSCVGWAVGYAARAYYADRAGRNITRWSNIPSPAYIYDSIKNSASCSVGSSIAEALNLLERGSLSLRQFPYSARRCSRPPDWLRSRAIDFRIDGWHLVDTSNLDQIKSELYKGNPVILALHVAKSFFGLKPGEIYHYSSDAHYVGYHAITAVGYDEARQAIKVINSWGSRWAGDGFGWISYDAFPNDVPSAYVMQVAHPPKPVPPPNPPAPSPSPPSPAPQPNIIVLPHPGCSRVNISERNGKTVVVGFVGHDKDLDAIRKAAKGAEIDVQVRPWPQCEALLTLGKALARKDSPQVSIKAPADKTLAAGDHLVFDIRTPPYTSYLNVAYFQADGSVINLIQPGVGSFKAYPPNSQLELGKQAGRRRFRVSAPFGREMLIVLAAKSPVFPDALPLKQTQRQFLTALRRAFLYKTNPQASRRDIVAGYDTIITKKGEAR